jgi:DNA invertase Pin-like site-specific DNA recombinase
LIVGYIRISTPEQNPQSQRDQLSAAGCEMIFEETASGARIDGPQLAQALSVLRRGDELIVFKLDRLARTTKQLIEVVEHLEKHGVKLKSLTESLDTSSASGRLFLHIMSSISEFERQNLRERVIAGIESAKSRGRVGGRPRAMGDEDLKVARALLKDETIAMADVAKRLGVGVSTLYRSFPGGRSAK